MTGLRKIAWVAPLVLLSAACGGGDEPRSAAPTVVVTVQAPVPQESATPAKKKPAPAPTVTVTAAAPAPARLLTAPDVNIDLNNKPCATMRSKGWEYSEVYDWYVVHGKPDAMDADLNSIPCETVYTSSEIQAYEDALDAFTVLRSFETCAEAAAVGAGPFEYGDPRYRSDLDYDDDGVACE